MGEENHFNSEQKINTFEDLYKEFSLPIYRYLLRLSGSEQNATDLTQETFYQAIKSVHRFRGDSKVSTWLYRIARNLYLNEERLQKNEKEKNLRASQLIADPHNGGKGPEEVLLEKEFVENIKEVLGVLPEPYRTVLILKEIEGLSHGKIAEILEKSVPSAKVLLYRAKERFRERYTKMGGKMRI